MFTRQNIAGFLQGFFVLPLSALFGVLVSLLFHWQHVKEALCVALFVLFPLFGAIRTRQHALLSGLLAGLAATALSYFAFRAPS